MIRNCKQHSMCRGVSTWAGLFWWWEVAGSRPTVSAWEPDVAKLWLCLEESWKTHKSHNLFFESGLQTDWISIVIGRKTRFCSLSFWVSTWSSEVPPCYVHVSLTQQHQRKQTLFTNAVPHFAALHENSILHSISCSPAGWTMIKRKSTAEGSVPY